MINVVNFISLFHLYTHLALPSSQSCTAIYCNDIYVNAAHTEKESEGRAGRFYLILALRLFFFECIEEIRRRLRIDVRNENGKEH